VFYLFLRVSRLLLYSIVFLTKIAICKDKQTYFLVRQRVLRQFVTRSQNLSRANKIKIIEKLKTLIKKTYILVDITSWVRFAIAYEEFMLENRANRLVYS